MGDLGDLSEWTVVVFMLVIGLTFILTFLTLDLIRRMKGQTCHKCAYYETIKHEGCEHTEEFNEEVCGVSLGYEPLPWTETCSQFEKGEDQ